MVKLTAQQISWLYPYDKEPTHNMSRVANAHDICEEMRYTALNKQVLHLDIDDHDGLRCSVMGHHPLDIMGRKFFPQYYKLVPGKTLEPRMQQVFLDGDTFEVDYLFWLLTRDYNINVSSSQGALSWRGKVSGHYDYIVQLPDGTFVLLELKTCNQNYFQSLLRQRNYEVVRSRYGEDLQFVTDAMSDFRGHITQAALYRDTLTNESGLFVPDATCVIVKDKSTANLLIYELPENTDDILERAESIVQLYNSLESWEEALTKIRIPDPKLELRQRQRTSRYLLPPSMYGSPIVPLIYEWVGDKSTFLLGFALPKYVYHMIKGKIVETLNSICTDGSFGAFIYEMSEAESRIEAWLDYQYWRNL